MKKDMLENQTNLAGVSYTRFTGTSFERHLGMAQRELGSEPLDMRTGEPAIPVSG
jgi:hypothetical protein